MNLDERYRYFYFIFVIDEYEFNSNMKQPNYGVRRDTNINTVLIFISSIAIR